MMRCDAHTVQSDCVVGKAKRADGYGGTHVRWPRECGAGDGALNVVTEMMVEMIVVVVVVVVMAGMHGREQITQSIYEAV